MRLLFLLAVLAAGSAYAIYAFTVLNFLSGSGRLGPGFFPRILGCGIVLLTLTSLFGEARRALATPGYLSVPPGVFPGGALLIIAMSVAYLAGLRVLGAMPATAIFLFVTLQIVNRGRLVQNLLIAAIVPALFYMLFRNLLNASIPQGVIALPF